VAGPFSGRPQLFPKTFPKTCSFSRGAATGGHEHLESNRSPSALRPAASVHGIPEGGQFAATAHAEPSIELLGATDSYFADRADQQMVQHQKFAGSTEAEALLSQYTSPAELMRMAYRSAEMWRRKYSQAGKSQTWDGDDIAQETVLRVMKEVNSGKPITDFNSWSTVPPSYQSVPLSNKFSAEDRRAYRIFDAARQNSANEGRTMTPA
jgi:hypothetical protein